MKFDDLDARMRVYETAHDHCVIPGVYLVARLDGRGFTRFTKETMDYERPFDPRFRDVMLATVRHLMECGLRVIYGYTQSDEISLLFHRDADVFGRKERKLNSVLAGEASGVASLGFGVPVAFDCRISQLPERRLVVDYFRWRHEDAHRNALNAHCYWLLRNDGVVAEEADAAFAGRSIAHKNEFLHQRGVNFDRLPAWHKRGCGLAWREVTVEGQNPKTGEVVTARRSRIAVDMELALGDEYARYIEHILEGA